MTNRFRDLDGGDLAWQLAVETVRGAGLISVHVVVFCSNPETLEAKVSQWRRVHVTSDPDVLFKFIRARK